MLVLTNWPQFQFLCEMRKSMKQKNVKKINEIVGNLTELETAIAQHSYYDGPATKTKQLEWFRKLQEITAKLNRIYRDETEL